MTVGGRRSGVPSGGTVDSMQCPCHGTSSLIVGGPSSASNAAAGSLGLEGRLAHQGTGDSGGCTPSPVAQACRGRDRWIGGLGKQLTPPSSSSTHPSATELWSAVCRQLSFSAASLPANYHRVFCFISFHHIVHTRTRISQLQCVHHDDPTCEDEYSPPGHQPKLVP